MLREAPVAGGWDAGTTAGAGAGVTGIPATGTISPAAGTASVACGIDAGVGAGASPVAGVGVGVGSDAAGDAGAGKAATAEFAVDDGEGAGANGSNTGAAALATVAWPEVTACDGARVNRWPGQIVYGVAIPFHWARSRKSTPFRKAIE